MTIATGYSIRITFAQCSLEVTGDAAFCREQVALWYAMLRALSANDIAAATLRTMPATPYGQ